jgi:predicted methyltransferase
VTPRSLSRLAGAAVALLFAGGLASAAAPAPFTAALADPSRPAADVARDANRKPDETLAFIGLKPGDVVADYIANSGYFTRLFADVVGPRGRVYAVELDEIVGFRNVAKGYAALKAWAPSRPNVTLTTVPVARALAFPEKLDVFWISQNYHDLHDKFLGPVDTAALNRQVFAALKPGGRYIVLDHSAVTGAPADVTETLHRIDEDVVKREVEAAGFVLEAESHVLANPADPRTANVFDKSIAGRTDQFILKFRKPKA